MENNSDPELLYGVPAIAAYLGLGKRQAYHLVDNGTLPTFRVGGRICARRSKLNDWMVELEAQANGEGGRDA